MSAHPHELQGLRPPAANVERVPDPIQNGVDTRLPNAERVVTHAPMAKNRDSLILGLVLLAVAAFGAFVWTQDADATRRGDYFACWTDSCRKASAADAANRLGGASDVDALPDQL